MDRILTPDGRLIHDRWMRRYRTLAYGCITIAGVLLACSPVLYAALGFLGFLMSLFLAGGGLSCVLGQVLNRWAGEYVGIPLVASAFLVFGIVTFAGNATAAPFIAMANLLILIGVSFSLAARWRQVRAVYRLALHLSLLGR